MCACPRAIALAQLAPVSAALTTQAACELASTRMSWLPSSLMRYLAHELHCTDIHITEVHHTYQLSALPADLQSPDMS